MDSRTVLLALCLLATVLLVHGDEPRQHQQQQHHPRPVRSNLRYKRMYVMCPPKFSRIGNECYYISPNKLNWLDAYFDCKDHNSKLAEPMKYEDKHLRRYLQKIQHHEDLWIGGTYNWKSNKWQWGHNGREMDYQSFSQMVPGRDLKFNCALLRADLKFRWSAEECTKKINFICQHRMPLVSETSRNQVYSRWNETFPNQKANEKLVYIVSDPNNRNRTDPGSVRIYNSMKQVFRSNPSIQPRPASHRRKQNRGRKHQQQQPAVVNNRTEYIPADVVYRKQQVAQYAPEAHNENSLDNGHSPRNGYSVPRFNVDFTPRNGRNRDASLARNGYPRDPVRLPNMNHPYQHPHQHRHQSGMYSGPARKPTKHMQQAPHYHTPNTLPPYRPPPPTMTTTTTTTTTTPAPTTTTHRPTTTTEKDSYPTTEEPTTVYQPITSAPKRLSAMSPEEKKIQRELLRERLRRLSPEEQQFFFQDRARRKRLKEQQLRKLKEQQQDNEVVHE